MKINKKAQEEMVGFALIIIIVAVILVVFLSFGLKDRGSGVESYEVDSFIQSFLQYTTECRDNYDYLSIKDLIFDCSNEEVCSNGENSCEVLETELKGIVQESWKVGEEAVNKGYELKITSNDAEWLLIQEGNVTKNSRGGSQLFSKTGNSIKIFFTIYN